jgi:hypothetical protein
MPYNILWQIIPFSKEKQLLMERCDIFKSTQSLSRGIRIEKEKELCES